ncbi:hypothetical protein KUCAC02_037528 [Chaenocephalus aceratus]|nr:hypothetical protein KUCAC02_037528 [Chaenocephalus aceratus]
MQVRDMDSLQQITKIINNSRRGDPADWTGRPLRTRDPEDWTGRPLRTRDPEDWTGRPLRPRGLDLESLWTERP